eukprot:COSAG05_NODE_23807_length_255_cov_1.000000_1_plen_30_part_01
MLARILGAWKHRATATTAESQVRHERRHGI